MFRSRFNDVLPSKLPHFGPQDVERGVNDGPPTQQVQQLLCAVLALVLNRKKPVEYVLGLYCWKSLLEDCEEEIRLTCIYNA